MNIVAGKQYFAIGIKVTLIGHLIPAWVLQPGMAIIFMERNGV
jgi:hypothetical protein